MNDIRMWNIREMRICIEWGKTFEAYQRLSHFDQFALVRNFAFAFNLLNRVFYSPDHGPDKIVFQNGAFIMRQPQQQNILAQNEENMQVMELFKNWEVDPFVKELCMKRA
ncbi:hypothetical protein OESDEN_14183 [Oesophagostomum dentatum]|uniref:NR LBD domain-containing protein n=1 Tax=Oesophagostomum dentatum TaxID=61180 RepID=A0A0B1SL75_OESDE|nr:hypothetical protein OESDEN_14183 [Oesophagostomum dentatum]